MAYSCNPCGESYCNCRLMWSWSVQFKMWSDCHFRCDAGTAAGGQLPLLQELLPTAPADAGGGGSGCGAGAGGAGSKWKVVVTYAVQVSRSCFHCLSLSFHCPFLNKKNTCSLPFSQARSKPVDDPSAKIDGAFMNAGAVCASHFMQQTWTATQHDGPNHLGLWSIRCSRRRRL